MANKKTLAKKKNKANVSRVQTKKITKNGNNKSQKASNNLNNTQKIDVKQIKKIAAKNKLSRQDLEKKLENNIQNKEPEVIYIKKKRFRLKTWAFWLFFVIFAGTILYSGFKIYTWMKDNNEINNLEKEINNLVEYEYTNEPGTLVNPPEIYKEDEKDKAPAYISDYWYYVKFPFYDVDFTELITKNSDTIAYIHINNTNVNYPVVQTTDNEFYLTHAFNKKENDAGWVYMDYRNKLDPMSDNIVIYGHGRQNNTVFGSLKKALTETWQNNKDNFIINISTPNTNYIYQIFSIYTIESESYYIQTDFYTSEEKQKWIDVMVSRNTAKNINAIVDVNDKILTLSTCYNDDGIRIVVQAKLLKSSN